MWSDYTKALRYSLTVLYSLDSCPLRCHGRRPTAALGGAADAVVAAAVVVVVVTAVVIVVAAAFRPSLVSRVVALRGNLR